MPGPGDLLAPAVGALFGLALVAVGLALSRLGVRNWRRARTASRVERTDLAAVRPGDGFVLVSGEVAPAGAGTGTGTGDPEESTPAPEDGGDAPVPGLEGDVPSVEAGIAGTEALAVETAVESKTPSQGSFSPSLTTDHQSADAVPFVLADGTGTVRVEVPDEGAVDLDPDVVETVSFDSLAVTDGEIGEDVPAGVREYVRTHNTAPTGTRWFRQGALVPGDRATVLAEATAGPAGVDAPDVTLTGVDHPRRVVLAHGGELGPRFTGEWRALALALVGTVSVLAGLLVFAMVAGSAVP